MAALLMIELSWLTFRIENKLLCSFGLIFFYIFLLYFNYPNWTEIDIKKQGSYTLKSRITLLRKGPIFFIKVIQVKKKIC